MGRHQYVKEIKVTTTGQGQRTAFYGKKFNIWHFSNVGLSFEVTLKSLVNAEVYLEHSFGLVKLASFAVKARVL